MEFLKQIETLFSTGTAGGLTDGQLLERFLERRDDAEAAFAALVDRHGGMVLRVCRQILRAEQDAEDAAQAAFLVLVRRASAINRRESIACWLHGVALRVAATARTAATRRRTRERRSAEMRTPGPVIDSDLGAIDDHECCFTTFVIDKHGNLIFAMWRDAIGPATLAVAKDGWPLWNSAGRFETETELDVEDEFKFYAEWELCSLAGALEDQFGLPRSPLPKSKPVIRKPDEPREAKVFKGKVVDLDGGPVAGATIASEFDGQRKRTVQSGPNGEFVLSEEEPMGWIDLTVEAPGFASRSFHFTVSRERESALDPNATVDPSGIIRQPLILSAGAKVEGRVFKNAKPVAGAVIGLKYVDHQLQPAWRSLEARTDEKGLFHFPHVLSEQSLWVYAKLGTLADGAQTSRSARNGGRGIDARRRRASRRKRPHLGWPRDLLGRQAGASGARGVCQLPECRWLF